MKKNGKSVPPLKCRLINARSLVNKIDELKVIVHREEIDILCITESWANSSVADIELNIPGYSLIRKE